MEISDEKQAEIDFLDVIDISEFAKLQSKIEPLKRINLDDDVSIDLENARMIIEGEDAEDDDEDEEEAKHEQITPCRKKKLFLGIIESIGIDEEDKDTENKNGKLVVDEGNLSIETIGHKNYLIFRNYVGQDLYKGFMLLFRSQCSLIKVEHTKSEDLRKVKL